MTNTLETLTTKITDKVFVAGDKKRIQLLNEFVFRFSAFSKQDEAKIACILERIAQSKDYDSMSVEARMAKRYGVIKHYTETQQQQKLEGALQLTVPMVEVVKDKFGEVETLYYHPMQLNRQEFNQALETDWRFLEKNHDSNDEAAKIKSANRFMAITLKFYNVLFNRADLVSEIAKKYAHLQYFWLENS